MKAEAAYTFKVILLGDATVGKTHLYTRFTTEKIPESPEATIGIAFGQKVIHSRDGTPLKIQLWDTAGQEKYKSIVQHHYRRAVGALLVYDVTNQESFVKIRDWLQEFRGNGEQDAVVMLVGNKIDMDRKNPEARKVRKELAMAFASSNGLLFMETSAVENTNVEQSFMALAEEIYQRQKKKASALGAASLNGGGSGVGMGGQTKTIQLSNDMLSGSLVLEERKADDCCGLLSSIH